MIRLRNFKAPPNVFISLLLAVALIFFMAGPALGSANTVNHDIGPAVTLAGAAQILGAAPTIASTAMRSIWSTVVGTWWQHATNTLNAYPDIGRTANILFVLLIALVAFDIGRRRSFTHKGGAVTAFGSSTRSRIKEAWASAQINLVRTVGQLLTALIDVGAQKNFTAVSSS